MSGDREKTAGEAAKEKVQRRKASKTTDQAAEAAAPTPADADVRPGDETDKAKSSEELRAEVEAAREQLAGSVEELTDRVDPRPKIEDARRTAADNAAPIAGVLALLLVLIVWRRRRR